MQTEFRTILWRRGLSMMLFVLFSVTVAMAQVLVRGTVVDQTGESVIGASIQVKGTTQGTITDIDGKFSLGVPNKKSIIVISFIGYATKELQVDTSKPMSIVLEEAQENMESLSDSIDYFWESVKDNINTIEDAEWIREYALSAAAELIQVAAMAQKAMRGYEVEK